MNFLIFGAPGAGKGTQSQELARHYRLAKVAVGDIFRNEVKRKTDLGKEVLAYMEKGLLVPDTIVDAIVEKNLPAHDFILDGYPRTLAQAKTLQHLLDSKKSHVDAVLFLDVSGEKAVERLSGRRICKKCGANYHVKNIPPKRPGICDSCGEPLVQRDDDTEETILKRLQVYKQESLPLLAYYKDRIISIDANKNKDAALSDIIAAVERLR